MSEAPDGRQPTRLLWSQALAGLSLGGLVLLFTWLNIVREEGSLARWLVQCLPLLILVPGLLRQSHRSYSWLCFVVILYMIPAITQVVMLLGYRGAERPPGHYADFLFLFLTVVLFFSAMFTSRWLQYWQWQPDRFQQDSLSRNRKTRNNDEQ